MLKIFIDKVDAHLLETIDREDLKASYVQNPNKLGAGRVRGYLPHGQSNEVGGWEVRNTGAIMTYRRNREMKYRYI